MGKKGFLLIGLLCIAALVAYLFERRLCPLWAGEGFQSGSIDIVVARYEEDISWINDIPIDSYSRIYIYNKGSHAQFSIPKSKTFTLPNYGREAHTYLHHVIENYDRLADVTIFLPGSAWYKESKKYRVMKVVNRVGKTRDSVIIGHRDEQTLHDVHGFTIGSYEVTNEENRKKNPETALTPALDRPLGKWFEKRFPGESISYVSYTGIFAASKRDILKRPRSFYERLLNEHLHTNAEVVHYSERLWKNIFSIEDHKCLDDKYSS